jgi:hypothetical protein
MLRYYRAGRYWLLEGLPVLPWPRGGGLELTENETSQALAKSRVKAGSQRRPGRLKVLVSEGK